MLQDLARGVLWVWVQDRTSQDTDKLPSWSVYIVPWCKVHPYHIPTKQDTNPCNNGQVKPVEADDEAVFSAASSSAVTPPSCTSVAPISSYHASHRGAKGVPSGASSIARPHVTCSPTSSIWTSLGGMSNSSTLLDARSCPHQKNFSFSTIICHGIGIYHSSGTLKTL